MSNRIHLLILPISFPSGVAAGAGGEYNRLAIARDGDGRPVLRGTSFAGVLRRAYSKEQGLTVAHLSAATFFGEALDGDKQGKPSALRVSDSLIECGKQLTRERTHHLRNRHTKTVARGGLFSLEYCPPKSTANIVLWMTDSFDGGEGAAFLKNVANIVSRGLCVGGQSARGIGQIEYRDKPMLRTFDLSNLDDHADMLDIDLALRLEPNSIPTGMLAVDTHEDDQNSLNIQLSLQIPRGQDLLVGDGRGLNHEIEPQSVLAADGKLYWKLPGSTLRGLFRSWMTKLAAKDGKPVADNFARQQKYQEKQEPFSDEINGDNLGRCFLPEEERKTSNPKITCPIANLFGSLYGAGRIHFSDSLVIAESANSKYVEQVRMHVAVDRITGGAAENMLFNNSVLVSTESTRCSDPFVVKIRISDPNPEEIGWLRKTIIALDIGLLRVGSSKSSGRLELSCPPQAKGLQESLIQDIQPRHSQRQKS